MDSGYQLKDDNRTETTNTPTEQQTLQQYYYL